jgi:hypothetical protein
MIEVLGESSEKGYTRKSIGNWVARWREMCFGGIKGFVLNCEENLVLGIEIWGFGWGFYVGC